MKNTIKVLTTILLVFLCLSCDHTIVVEKTGLPKGLYINKKEYEEEKALWEKDNDIQYYEFTYQIRVDSYIPVEARVYVDKNAQTNEMIIRQRGGLTKDEYIRKGNSEEEWNDTTNQETAYYYFKSIDELLEYLGKKLSEYENGVNDGTYYNATCNVEYFMCGIPKNIELKGQRTEDPSSLMQNIRIYISNFDSK